MTSCSVAWKIHTVDPHSGNTGSGVIFCIWQWWKLYKLFHVLILLSHIYIYITWCKGYRGSLKTYSSIHVFSQVTEQLLSHIGRNKNQKYHLQRSSAQGTDEKKNNDPSYSKSFHVFSSKFHQSSKLLDLLKIHKVSAFASSSHEEATWLCAGTKRSMRSIQSSNQCQCQELAFQF